MIPVLIIGKSGAGKSASLRNMPTEGTIVVNVLGKPLPFRNKLKTVHVDDYTLIQYSIKKAEYDRYIIDDAGYLITNHFMADHSKDASGNAVFVLYNKLADEFFSMIKGFQNYQSNARVYIIMHEDKNDMGDVKPKTIGKLLDDKVCLEGMFTICLRAMVSQGKHIFRTQSDGFDTAKTPMGMFDSEEIDNDLYEVDKAITEYYNIGGQSNETDTKLG